MTLYEYSEEEHRRIQERDKTALKEQLAEAQTNLKHSESKLAVAESKLAMAESSLKQSESKLQQSESKLTQAIQNTISMLQSMDCDDSFICSKLCEIYQISTTDATDHLEKYNIQN